MFSELDENEWAQILYETLDNNKLVLDLQRVSRISQIYDIYLNELWVLHYKVLKKIELQEILLESLDLDYEERLNTIENFIINIKKNNFNFNYLNKFYIKYFNNLPFIKSDNYFNILKAENALKNKNWDLYKLNRLNIEHWNKNFKDYKNINSFKFKNK